MNKLNLNMLDRYLQPKNSYLLAAMTIFLVLYGALAAPKLPKFIADLFDNPIFRLLILFLIAYLSVKNITVALIVAVVFTLTMNFLNEQKFFESFVNGVTSNGVTYSTGQPLVQTGPSPIGIPTSVPATTVPTVTTVPATTVPTTITTLPATPIPATVPTTVPTTTVPITATTLPSTVPTTTVPTTTVAQLDVIETARRAGNFNTLLRALESAGLIGAIRSGQGITVFAPTDQAFAKLPEGTLQRLLNNPTELAKILQYHVVPRRLTSREVLAVAQHPTLSGQSLNVQDLKIITTDIPTKNGIIHVIDEVLIPK